MQAVVGQRAPDDETSGPMTLSTDRVRHATSLRRRVPRELAQMAAAILVLVVVAGVLAATFRTQGQHQAGEIGSGATPATSAVLPLTITENGISVTLGLVDSTGSATRFHVNVALPVDAVGQPRDFILGQSPADNVHVDGLTTRANALHATENDVNRSNATLYLDYPSPLPTNQTVTLTIQQLWFPAKPAAANSTPRDYATYTPAPVVMQAVKGPWVFHITPTAVAAQPLPTPSGSAGTCSDVGLNLPPDVDCYYGVSTILAQKLVDFPIVEPTPLPFVLTRDDFGASVYRVGTTSVNRPNYMSVYYPLKSGQQRVNLVETTDPAALPKINGEMTSTSMIIDGVTVNRFGAGTTNAGLTSFVWTQAGVSSSIECSNISSNPNSSVTDEALQQMVTSIIEQRVRLMTPTSSSPVASKVLLTTDANGDGGA
jgi:hypothetical protein